MIITIDLQTNFGQTYITLGIMDNIMMGNY